MSEERKTREIVKLAGPGRISERVMNAGKDEMNLVEFPLAGLSDRLPAGQNSLVFEDCIWDRSRRESARRRLTITGSAEYKLPTALDDEVVLGLIQLSRAHRFESRRVTFRPVQLIRLLGWRAEGRSYDRLEMSLRRWLGVTLYYDNAWWDMARKAWVDEHFHLIDHVVIRRRTGPGGSARRRTSNGAEWSIVWNEVVFRSFQAGYLRPLDMKLYRKLKSGAAKRMYRFLDKRFYRSNRVEFDLRVFACEHVGFARAYDNSQLKRRLRPAIADLERVGYLEPLPAAERFHKLCRGQWMIRLVRRQDLRRRKRKGSGCRELESVLVDRGVSVPVATRVVREYPHKAIRECVFTFDRLQGTRGPVKLRNPAGFLVNSIQAIGDGPNQPSLDPETQRPSKSRGLNAAETHKLQKDQERDNERRIIDEYLATLSPSELERLETEALKHANVTLRKGYYRSREENNLRRIQDYRTIILHSHVRKTRCLQHQRR